ncbi:small ribosomal subunit biogenesis GTPase RsgA [Gloeocapsa sp. PCC 73106]|uniref:small ribosomal subunit biogenesis GTPase RsgA n=1 Tax=Gloeocapsa sp. PCC 73106 TaxID=102232 RepID=UPI0002ACDC2A|nr:small ribosomal subunit biogenesis GTPase RsgA [Gloeocapsa sp. PCC 73106]ELR99759.1 ribosome small subunit-dependent GTPase A [Gloeocapsa sp. PCC 73106]
MREEKSENRLLGTVMAVQANYYFVCTDDKELLCTCRGRLKKIGQKAMVGDKVKVIEPAVRDGRGSIVEILPRHNLLSRPAIANVDHLLLLFALKDPPLEAWQLSRFLVKAESTQIKLSLCLNKADLVTDTERQDWHSRVQTWGYEPIIVSVTSQLGMSQLQARLDGKITILAGPSGVGKSTLTNALIPEVNQRVNTVSGKLHLGRHTTRHVELFSLPGSGFIADSPGFNQPDLQSEPRELALYFPEIIKLLSEKNCQFNDCLHRDEPNCAVRGDWERYPHYLKFLEELTELSSQQQQKPDLESQVKLKIGSAGEHYYEPKLESKKYRRLSRREKHQTLQEQVRYQTVEELAAEFEEEE